MDGMDMMKERTRAVFRRVIPCLVAGGICGAAIALGLVPNYVGIAAAVGIAMYLFLSVLRIRRRFG